MATRKLVHEEVFSASVADVFSLLHTPSSIRQWWGVSRAIVLPERGGIWAAVWGDVEDDPDYVTIATIREFEPPRRMVLCNYRYRARTGPLPFPADFVTEFAVELHSDDGAILRVTQDGFPETPEASEFHAACQRGWQNTFAGIRRFLAEREGPGTRQ